MKEQYLHSLFFVFTASIVDAISYSIFLPYFTFSILEAISCSILAKISRLLNLKQEERPDDTSQNQGKNRGRTVSSSPIYLSVHLSFFLSIYFIHLSIYIPNYFLFPEFMSAEIKILRYINSYISIYVYYLVVFQIS